MLVAIGQRQTQTVVMAHRKDGEPVLMLRLGEKVDWHLARKLGVALKDLTTPEAARAEFLKNPDLATHEAWKLHWIQAPLTHDDLAMVTGIPRKLLARQARDDDTFPGLKYGNTRRYFGYHAGEIVARAECGELRYVKKKGLLWLPEADGNPGTGGAE